MNGRMKLKATVIINLQKESEDFTKKGCYFLLSLETKIDQDARCDFSLKMFVSILCSTYLLAYRTFINQLVSKERPEN